MPSPPNDRIEGFRGTWTTEPADGWDEASIGASGPFLLHPRAIAVPGSEDDVRALTRWARAEGRSLIARGGATGMPGGNVGTDILVDLRSGFRDILAVNRDRREITVQPGVTVSEVEAAAASVGLTFPVQPSSLDRCVVGGMVANNAAGTRSFRYGAARDWVRSARVVLADGTTARLGALHAPASPGAGTGSVHGGSDPLMEAVSAALNEGGTDPREVTSDWPRVRKNSSGYALDRVLDSGSGLDLLIGSEGTLGLCTEITLALAQPPEARATLLVGVSDLSGVTRWSDWARELGASACEFIGRRLIELARVERDVELSDVARGAIALMMIEVDGTPGDVDSRRAALEAYARAESARFRVASTPAQAEVLWGIRRRASPAIRDAAAIGLRSMQFIEDSVVPTERLADYVRGVEMILSRAGTDSAIFGHAGDANVHVNPLVDLRRPDWPDRVRTVLEETVELVAELGGTLAGEHGDGRVRAPFAPRIWGGTRDRVFRAIKSRLDPDGLFSPGVVVARPGQDPLEGLSHLERSAS